MNFPAAPGPPAPRVLAGGTGEYVPAVSAINIIPPSAGRLNRVTGVITLFVSASTVITLMR